MCNSMPASALCPCAFCWPTAKKSQSCIHTIHKKYVPLKIKIEMSMLVTWWLLLGNSWVVIYVSELIRFMNCPLRNPYLGREVSKSTYWFKSYMNHATRKQYYNILRGKKVASNFILWSLTNLSSLSTQNPFSSKTPYSTVFALHGPYLCACSRLSKTLNMKIC